MDGENARNVQEDTWLIDRCRDLGASSSGNCPKVQVYTESDHVSELGLGLGCKHQLEF